MGKTRGRSPLTLELSFHRNDKVIGERRREKAEHPTLPGFQNARAGASDKLVSLGFSVETANHLGEKEDPEFLAWVATRIAERRAGRKSKEPIKNPESYGLAILEGERDAHAAMKQREAARAERRAVEKNRSKLEEIESYVTRAYGTHLKELAWQRYLDCPDTRQIESEFAKDLDEKSWLRKIAIRFHED